jgi:hypothetical protein
VGEDRKEHVSERFRRLLALYRKLDDGEWGGQDLEDATKTACKTVWPEINTQSSKYPTVAMSGPPTLPVIRGSGEKGGKSLGTPVSRVRTKPKATLRGARTMVASAKRERISGSVSGPSPILLLCVAACGRSEA